MMIRLNEQQQHTIKQLAWEVFNSSKVMIFGSRADMTQRGGDIDIYIQTDKKNGILQLKLTFLREFEKLFSEQKVDLLVDNGTKKKEIFEIAKKEGILL